MLLLLLAEILKRGPSGPYKRCAEKRSQVDYNQPFRTTGRDGNTLLPGAQRMAKHRWKLAKKEQEAVDTAASVAAARELMKAPPPPLMPTTPLRSSAPSPHVIPNPEIWPKTSC